jgi:hypothetical protein
LALHRREWVMDEKRQKMRQGSEDWYIYRYLRGQGCLPGSTFPAPQNACASGRFCFPFTAWIPKR